MASRATDRVTTPPMPAEFLQQLCRNLDQPNLKRCRLVCKNFSYAAENSLFRQVLLKRKLVKAMCYSGIMLWNDHVCMDFKSWSKYFVGQGFHLRDKTTISKFAKSLTSGEVEMHCQKICAHHHSEQLMRIFDIGTQDVTSDLAKLPQLEEVRFARGEDLLH